MGAHIALLGDSIFDNAAYTHGQPDVVTHLRRIVSDGTTATLLAVDGSTTADVLEKQVPGLPENVTHAAVSMGGNDAILQSDALNLPVTSTQEAPDLGPDSALLRGLPRPSGQPATAPIS